MLGVIAIAAKGLNRAHLLLRESNVLGGYWRLCSAFLSGFFIFALFLFGTTLTAQPVTSTVVLSL
jgi:hypothetical protein